MKKKKYAYDSILDKVFNNEPASFFIDGSGETGKTYLYRAILNTVRSKNLIALATAFSGIAASILPRGQTAHSKFKIPLKIEKKITCGVSERSGLAKLPQLAKLHRYSGVTGKTYLYRAILATVRSKNLIVLAIASS